MSEIRHPPVQKALDQLKNLSNDEETRWRALARERALHDETSLLADARRKGLEEGLHQGQTALLHRLLSNRFGPLPEWAKARLEAAGPEQLQGWAEAIFDAQSLKALLGETV